MTSITKHKIIFDTDPGVDDAMALAFALAHPAIELLGITTVFGNVTTAQATQNALYLTQLAGRKITIAQGASTPLEKTSKPPPDFIHGADGLGNLPERFLNSPSSQAALSDLNAAQWIVQQAHKYPQQISLIPVGPLTNIALALQIEPELPKLVKQLIFMGGSAQTAGNVSPVAEANAWGDPHAMDAVMCAGFDLTMLGLDVTYSVVNPVSFFEKLALEKKHVFTDTLLHAVKFYSKFYATRYPELAKNAGCFGHDVHALMALVRPDFYQMKTGRLRCVTEGIAQGQTIFHDRLEIDFPQEGYGKEIPLAKVALDVSGIDMLNDFEETLMSDWLTPHASQSSAHC